MKYILKLATKSLLLLSLISITVYSMDDASSETSDLREPLKTKKHKKRVRKKKKKQAVIVQEVTNCPLCQESVDDPNTPIITLEICGHKLHEECARAIFTDHTKQHLNDRELDSLPISDQEIYLQAPELTEFAWCRACWPTCLCCGEIAYEYIKDHHHHDRTKKKIDTNNELYKTRRYREPQPTLGSSSTP